MEIKGTGRISIEIDELDLKHHCGAFRLKQIPCVIKKGKLASLKATKSFLQLLCFIRKENASCESSNAC